MKPTACFLLPLGLNTSPFNFKILDQGAFSSKQLRPCARVEKQLSRDFPDRFGNVTKLT